MVKMVNFTLYFFLPQLENFKVLVNAFGGNLKLPFNSLK